MYKFLLKVILFTGALWMWQAGRAQDVHFSQYNASPLMLNPALAGMNTCDYRVYTNARLQWPTISDGFVYRTFAAGADMSIGKVSKFNSFAGAGLSLYSDQAGSLNLSTHRADLTIAYHFMLNRKGTMQISAGLQGGFNYKGLNASKATFDGQYINGVYDPNAPGEVLGRTRVMFADAGLGLLFSAVVKNDINFYSGFALNHVNQPKISFFPSGQTGSFAANERLYMKITLHGGASLPITPNGRVTVLPNYAVFVQGPAYQFIVGCGIKSTIGHNPRSSTSAIAIGAQYRGLYDAIIFHVRYDYKGFSGGLSYDMNVSKLTPASKTIGAPELSLMYQGCYRKKPRPGHCPVML